MRLLLFFLLFSNALLGQCNVSRYARPYLALPSFFGLYFANQCISQPIRDTTICVKVARVNQGQVAAFSYSSPSGAPAFVTSVKQYNSACIHIADGTLIPAGTDTITICYAIQTTLIDNFCPYTVLAGGLAVDWCGIYAYYSEGNIKLRFETCSNSGTKRFDIITSPDAQSWVSILGVNPQQETKSTLSDYNVCFPAHRSGMNYYAVREIDVNGNTKVSDIVYVDVPSVPTEQGFDLLGRPASSQSYMFYLRKQ